MSPLLPIRSYLIRDGGLSHSSFRVLRNLLPYYLCAPATAALKMIIVSIDQAQDANRVKPMVDGFGWEYEVLLDPNGDFKRAMNVQNVPHVFVLDGKGKIIYNHAGYVDGGEQDIYEALL